MASEKELYEYLAASVQTRSELRAGRQPKIGNMLLVVGLLATGVLTLSGNMEDLLPAHPVLFWVRAGFFAVALGSALVGVYKLLGYVRGIGVVPAPSVDRVGELLQWNGEEDKDKLFRGFANNYLKVIDLCREQDQLLWEQNKSASCWARVAVFLAGAYCVAWVVTGFLAYGRMEPLPTSERGVHMYMLGDDEQGEPEPERSQEPEQPDEQPSVEGDPELLMEADNDDIDIKDDTATGENE